MDLLIIFGIFIAAMLGSLFTGHTMLIGLLVGLAGFTIAGLRRKHSLGAMYRSAMHTVRESLIVVSVMLVIGFLTASWRVSGTITVFVYFGMKIITPALFLLITFLLCVLLSYAIGTSFGVAGTLGVIFMALARSGGVDPVLTAGVIMSGIMFGDRTSPVSSSANLVAGVTGTKIMDNVPLLMRTGILPFVVTLLVYIPVSILHPISHVDAEMVEAFENSFSLSAWSFVPAVIMLVLPLFRIPVLWCMGLSIAAASAVALLVEKVPAQVLLRTLVFGYAADGDGLARILNGGGLISMLELIAILALSCSYSGIFTETKMLDGVQELLAGKCRRRGRFAVLSVVSILSGMVFCNQTISILIGHDLLGEPYKTTGGSGQELAIDMGNSLILLTCMVPWAIGCTFPMTLFGTPPTAILFAVYMYAVPVCYLFTKRRWFPDK